MRTEHNGNDCTHNSESFWGKILNMCPNCLDFNLLYLWAQYLCCLLFIFCCRNYSLKPLVHVYFLKDTIFIEFF